MKIFQFVSIFLFATINLVLAQESTRLVPFLKGNKFGFTDQNKVFIIEPKFDNAYPFGYTTNDTFYPDYALVQLEDAMYLLDKKGNLQRKDDFDKKEASNSFTVAQIEEVVSFDYFVFEKNGKKGVIDQNKKIILEPVYEYLYLIRFHKPYHDEKRKNNYKPTFASVRENNEPKLIRIDKLQIYDDITLSSFNSKSNHLIVDTKEGNQAILVDDKIISISPEYDKILKFYEEQELVSVYKIIDNHPVTIYIDLKGNEYYEK